MSGGPNSLVDRFDKLDGTDYEDDFDLDTEGDEDEGSDASDDDSDDLDVSDTDNDEVSDGSGDEDADDNAEGGQEDRAQRPDGKPAGKTDASDVKRLANGLHTDAKGNIVDPRDGTIIARAGSERRLFEKNVRMQGELTNAGTRVQELERNLAQVQFLNDIPRQYGLTNDDVQSALALSTVFKKDPVSAAKKVLEMALAAGHNLSEILGEGGDAIELKAVSQMLDQRLAPLTQRQQQESEANRARVEAERGVRAFFDAHEYAEEHGPVIDRLMGQNPSLSPEKAYYELKLFATKHGLDFSQPLAPQIARMQSRGRGAQPNRQGNQPRQRSMPNGRGSVPTVTRRVNDTDQFDPRNSWDDIIKGVTNRR